MRRREFIGLLGGAAAVSWPLAAHAQPLDKRPRRIAYLSGASRAATGKVVAAFLEGMRTHGYVEGRDFEMDYRWAEGHLERMTTLAEELVRSKPDLILAAIMSAGQDHRASQAVNRPARAQDGQTQVAAAGDPGLHRFAATRRRAGYTHLTWRALQNAPAGHVRTNRDIY